MLNKQVLSTELNYLLKLSGEAVLGESNTIQISDNNVVYAQVKLDELNTITPNLCSASFDGDALIDNDNCALAVNTGVATYTPYISPTDASCTMIFTNLSSEIVDQNGCNNTVSLAVLDAGFAGSGTWNGVDCIFSASDLSTEVDCTMLADHLNNDIFKNQIDVAGVFIPAVDEVLATCSGSYIDTTSFINCFDLTGSHPTTNFFDGSLTTGLSLSCDGIDFVDFDYRGFNANFVNDISDSTESVMLFKPFAITTGDVTIGGENGLHINSIETQAGDYNITTLCDNDNLTMFTVLSCC